MAGIQSYGAMSGALLIRAYTERDKCFVETLEQMCEVHATWRKKNEDYHFKMKSLKDMVDSHPNKFISGQHLSKLDAFAQSKDVCLDRSIMMMHLDPKEFANVHGVGKIAVDQLERYQETVLTLAGPTYGAKIQGLAKHKNGLVNFELPIITNIYSKNESIS